MRLPWSHSEPVPVHANEPHAFQAIRDAGMSTGLVGMSALEGSSLNQVAVTNRYLRTSGCAVPGCGKVQDDPIHEPAE